MLHPKLVAVMAITFITLSSLISPASAHAGHTKPDSNVIQYNLPSANDPQECVYLAFGAQEAIWGPAVSQVQQALARIVNACAAFQPVRIIARPNEVTIAQYLIDSAVASNVTYLPLELDDIWARDTLPVVVRDTTVMEGDKRVAVSLNFNGWGRKREVFSLDATLAQRLASYLGAPFQSAGIVGEGGGLETDGEGTAIMTESSWINVNRNPGIIKTAILKEMTKMFGIQKIIWLPGMRGKDTTDGHVNFYARFVRPTVVLVHIEQDQSYYNYQVTQRHLTILRQTMDAKNRPLTVLQLYGPRTSRLTSQNSANKNVALGYTNFLVVNGAVIIPEFGDDEADNAAKETIQSAYPDRTVIQINVDILACGGGGIHRATMNQPL